MKYKINFISGFKFSFIEIANVFKALCESANRLKDVAEITSYNESKTKILLNFLVESGMTAKRNFKVTVLGETVHKGDGFLENIGTIWLIHYFISSQKKLVIWNRLFNNILDEQPKDREKIFSYYTDLKDHISDYTYERNVRKEIKMVMDVYITERFSMLDLIHYDDNGYCQNRNGSVPELILLAAIIHFRDKYYPGSTAIDLNDICYSDNSPGRIFFLDERFLRNKLESLKNKGLIGLESRADLDQVRLNSDWTFEGVMEHYYKSI